jgi:4-hydroxybenzoate polyprenyltransferase
MKKTARYFLPFVDGFFLLRPVVLVPVWGFVLFGYFKGADIYITELPLVWITTSPFLFAWIMLFSLSVGCVFVLNQIADMNVDRINSGMPLLARRIASPRTAYCTATASALISIIVPFLTGRPMIAIFSIVTICIGAAYSFRPLYFSGRPFFDFLTNALGFGIIAFGMGWYCAGKNIFEPAFFIAAAPYFLLMCAGAISSTIPDINGDREGLKMTTAVVFGEKNAHRLATFFIIAAALYSLISGDAIASVCSIAAFPLYILYMLCPGRVFAESAYKIGGAICIVMASCILPQLVLYCGIVVAITWMYFRFRCCIAYPSLVPHENRSTCPEIS